MSDTEQAGVERSAVPVAGSGRARRCCRLGWWVAVVLAVVSGRVGAAERTPASGAGSPKAASETVRASPPAPSSQLKWDALSKSQVSKPGETEVEYAFTATNVSSAALSITGLHTTCGCTVAQLPPLPDAPLVLAAGASAVVRVKLDLHGKVGSIAKAVTVETSIGSVQLAVHADITADPSATGTGGTMGAARTRNIEIAARDRQAVFQGDCAKCHSTPAIGKMGEELYLAVCTLCHDASPRAAMIPDLNVPRGPRDLAFWNKWIAEGAPGTMMHAFAAAHGGPLTPEQVSSLARYVYDAFPRTPLVRPEGAPSGDTPVPTKP